MIRLFRHIPLLLTFALFAVSCSDDTSVSEEPIPEGYGRLVLTIGTADALVTRGAVSPYWLEGTVAERAINSYVILMCEGNNIIKVFTDNDAELSSHDDANNRFPSTVTLKSDLLPVGTRTFTFYGLVNFADEMLEDAFGDGGLSAIGTTLPTNFEAKAIKISNSKEVPTDGIPMTGKLTATVTINSGIVTTQDNSTPKKDLVLTLWRMMAKLQLNFINESSQQMDIMGIEIDPLNDGTAGTPLWQTFNGSSTLDLISPSNNDSHGDIDVVSNVVNGPWNCKSLSDDDPPAEQILASVPAKNGSTNGTATFIAYINETDATYTAVENQFSLRFKVKRGNTYDEYRYGMTTPYTDGNAGGNGFNVIRRNDWINIPIRFTDWQFQIDALPFPPIAGFQARILTADALGITFNTGGYIVLQPHFRKNADAPGVWRGLDDSEITLSLPEAESDYSGTTTKVAAINTTTETGITMEGNLGIFEQKFVRLPSGDIVGKLTNDPIYGTVTVTLTVKLENFYYQFQYSIIKKA